MPRVMRVLLCAVVVASMAPVLVASATGTPASPLWGGGVVADEAYYEVAPRVDAGVVVWADQDGGAIHSRQLPDGAAVVVYGDGFSRTPDVAGDVVVWAEHADDSAGDVWMKDVASGIVSEVATRTDVGEIRPRTDGEVVVWLQGSELDGYTVCGTVLATGVDFEVDMAPDTVTNVDVSQGVVAFSSGGGIYTYDVGAAELLGPLNTSGHADTVAIDGDVLVWSDDRNGNRDIYTYDRAKAQESAVCTDASGQTEPAVAGSVVVWQDDRDGEAADIGAYDLTTGVQYLVTDDEFANTSPATDGSHIVWVDDRFSDTNGEDVRWIGYDTIAPTTTSDVQPSYEGVAEITLHAEDDPFGSGVKETWYKVNYAGDWYDGPIEWTRPGRSIPLHYKSSDMVGNVEAYNVAYFDLISVDTVYTAIDGPSRYDTAVATSQKAFPKGAKCVVVATGENWPDALGGAALAKAKRAAVLLTLPTALPDAVLDEIERLGAQEAIILGGRNAVSEGVEAALVELLGDEQVDRIEGADRYETADMVARATREAMGYSPYKVLVATGQNFPDALGASPLAALGPWPLVLAPPGAGLTEGTKQTIEDIGSGYGVILGGEQAVSEQVVAELEAMFGKGHTTRLAGDDRYETSIECARFGVAHGLWWDGVALSTGANFPDALAGGMLQGQAGSVLLLTPSSALHPSVAAELEAQRDWIGNVTFLGGTAAVSQDVRDSVEAILK